MGGMTWERGSVWRRPAAVLIAAGVLLVFFLAFPTSPSSSTPLSFPASTAPVQSAPVVVIRGAERQGAEGRGAEGRGAEGRGAEGRGAEGRGSGVESVRGGGEYERCVRPQLAWDAPVAGGLVRGFAMEATGLLGALAALYPQRTTSPAQVSEHAETLPDKQSLPRSGTLLSRQLDGALNPRAVRSVPELALVTTFWEDAFVDGQLAASHAAQLRSLHHPRGSGFEALATQQRSHVDEGGEHVSVTSRNPSGSSSAQEAQQRHNERATEADEANEARAAGPQVYVSQWTPPGFHERLDWYRARLPSHHRPFRTVARLMYETTAIPQEWHQDTSRMDEIWVPSEWQRDVFIARGLPAAKLLPERLHKRFVFFTVGKWEARKNFALLMESFLEEFQNELAAVALVLRTEVPSTYLNAVLSKAGVALDNSPIVTLKQLNADELVMAYRAADAFVLTSHGEGFGRPPLEAMAMSLPTIATNWSGLTAFIRDDVALPIPVHSLEKYTDDKGTEEEWAHIKKDDVKQLMRKAFTDTAQMHKLGERARAMVVREFDDMAVGRQAFALVQAACVALET